MPLVFFLSKKNLFKNSFYEKKESHFTAKFFVSFENFKHAVYHTPSPELIVMDSDFIKSVEYQFFELFNRMREHALVPVIFIGRPNLDYCVIESVMNTIVFFLPSSVSADYLKSKIVIVLRVIMEFKKCTIASVLEVVSEYVNFKLFCDIDNRAEHAPRFLLGNEHADMITPREKEIISLLIKGLTYKEIASRISISVNTVKTHIRNVYKKLNIQNVKELLNLVLGSGNSFF